MNIECKENLTENQPFSPLSELVSQKVEILKFKHQKLEEQQKIKVNMLSSIKEDLSRQKVSLEKLLRDERTYSEELENRINTMKKQYSEVLQRSEESTQSLMHKLSILTSENQSLQMENMELNLKLKEKEALVFYLEENLNRIKLTNSDILIEEYKKRTEELSDLYNKSEKDRDYLQVILKNSTEATDKIIKSDPASQLEENNKTLLKDIKDLQDELKFHKMQKSELKLENSILKEKNLLFKDPGQDKLDYTNLNLKLQEIENVNKNLTQELKIVQEHKEKLEKEMDEYKCKVMQSVRLERNHIDDTDLAMEKYFIGQGLENLFVKISTGLYVFGTKKVNISMKNEKIICRVSGCYYSIEEFLRLDLIEKKNFVVSSPVSSKRETFTFTGKPSKANSLVSHLVSPTNKGRFRLSLDFESQSNDSKIKSLKLNSVKNSKRSIN
jgi:chromosome segregation ATPase